MPSLTLISGIDWESVGFGLGFGLVIHFYLVFVLLGIAKKFRVTEKRWPAWVPFVNWFLVARLALKPKKWAGIALALLFIPLIALFFRDQIKNAVGDMGITAVGFVSGLAVVAVLILHAILWSHITRRRGYSGWPGFIIPFSFPINLIILALLAWGPEGPKNKTHAAL